MKSKHYFLGTVIGIVQIESDNSYSKSDSTRLTKKTCIMKTTLLTLFASAISLTTVAQDVTTVNAYSTEISDNLDLRAVASIFGESANLEDFERRLNDPKLQISNLDLNNDNQVDYLRVIESVERNTHLIILQSVLARDVYQDVATIEVEKDRHNNVQVQVVGNVYMYGPNYIYEPVYVTNPIIYTSFWHGGYHPYVSNWYWGYYPTYYYAWNPYPVFRYRRNITVCINVHNHYNYVNVRRSQRAVALYGGHRSNGYEKQYPSRSFQQRHSKVANRYELDQQRNLRDVSVASNSPRNNGTRSNANTASNSIRENSNTRSNSIRSNSNIRSNSTTYDTRDNQSVKTQTSTPRSNIRTESNVPRVNAAVNTTSNGTRDNVSTRTQVNTPRPNTRTEVSTPRATTNYSTRESIVTSRNTNSNLSSTPRSNNNQRMISENRTQRVDNNSQRTSNQNASTRTSQNMRSQTSNSNSSRSNTTSGR